MKRICLRGPLLVLAGLTLAIPLTADTYDIMPSGDPSGATDTAAIQEALDLCTSSHSSCRIRLGAGQFWIRQLVAEGFHGSLRGMGVGTSVVSPVEDLPVNPDANMWDSYPTPAGGGNEWPLLLTFIGGKVRLSDISFEVLDPEPTTGWLTDHDPPQPRFNLMAVVQVTGASARSTIERVSVEGVASTAPGPGYSIWAGVQIQGLAGMRLSGRHSVSSSHFQSLGSGAYAYFLDKAVVTIGGQPGRGNTIEDCRYCAAGDNANRSRIEISHNEITTNPVFAVGVGLWQNGGDRSSFFQARRNTVDHRAAYGRGVCVSDNVRGATGQITLRAVVLHNEIDMGPLAGWQEGIALTATDRALVVGNRITGQSFQDIGAYGTTRCRLLVNDLDSSSSPQILLDAATSECLVVTDDPSAVQDDGTDNRIVSLSH